MLLCHIVLYLLYYVCLVFDQFEGAVYTFTSFVSNLNTNPNPCFSTIKNS